MNTTQITVKAWGANVVVTRQEIGTLVVLTGPCGQAVIQPDGSVSFSASTHVKAFSYQAGTGEDMAARMCARGVQSRGAIR